MEISGASSLENNDFNTYYALMVAFKTMKERCQQLQSRLAVVEEENVCLRLECRKDVSTAVVKISDNNERIMLHTLQEKVEQLTKQKSQLTHHIFMVAGENRQLWNRLTRLTRTNKTLGSQLTKISDTLKRCPPVQPSDILSFSLRDFVGPAKQETNQKCILTTDNGGREQSLEEISLRLINSIMLEKSDLEQQYAEMVELQNAATDINLQNVGFTYPEDPDTDSLEQLKQHDIRLSQTKGVLLAQQIQLKKALQNLKKLRKGTTCSNCRKNASKKMCQAGTQFDSDNNFREHGTTQTSLPSSLSLEKCSNAADNSDRDNKICPLCGMFCGKSVPFAEFHEHVLSHFAKEGSIDSFELVH